VLSDRRRDESEMTAAESSFVACLRPSVPNLDVWLHETNGIPWLIASVDVARAQAIVATWRIDFDGTTICSGLSPASLNWDDGVSAAKAGIDTQPPTGLAPIKGEPENLASVAADWLIAAIART
jgi:hypothetical protein